MTDAPAKKPLYRLTEAELREFVLGCCAGELFTSAQLPELELARLVFMPIMFGALDNVPLEDLGVVWEWLSEAGPRSVNGMPIFMSLHILHREDWQRAHAAILAELDRRKTIAIPETT